LYSTILRVTENSEALQNSILLLTFVVRKDVRQLFSWTHKDGDWFDEDKVRDDRFSYLTEVMGPSNLSFDEDDVLTNINDEDLRSCRRMSPRLRARAWRAMGIDLGLLLSSPVRKC